MAAAIRALNAKIRSNPYTDYICSTRALRPTPRDHFRFREQLQLRSRDVGKERKTRIGIVAMELDSWVGIYADEEM